MKLFVTALFVVFLFSSCSHKVYDAIDWQASKVTVDGNIQEWSDPLRFYDYKSKVNYTISNDRENLYVSMKISDFALRMKIVKGGMEFRIDTSGKKVFPIAFIFPIANQIVMKTNKRNDVHLQKFRGGQQENTGTNQKPLEQARDAQLVGFKYPLGGPLSMINNNSGIAAVANIDSLGTLTYEAKIPFNTFYKNTLSAADSNKVFSYEIKVNALPAPQVRESGNGGQSGGMGNGGMNRGGGMGGGMNGGMGGGHRGGGGMNHGGGGGHTATNNTGNSMLYEKTQIVKQLRLSFK